MTSPRIAEVIVFHPLTGDICVSAASSIQFCLAHLIRDVKFLTTLPDAATEAYGERLRRALKELFEVIHRRDELSAVAFERQLKAARDVVLDAGMTDVPTTRHAENMAKRFRKHGAAFFTFVTTPDVEPTNNCAEQAIRFVVIDRHITQGTRSETGRRWSERIWTTIATCAGQGRSVYGLPEGMRWELVRGSTVAFAVAVGNAGMREAMRRV